MNFYPYLLATRMKQGILVVPGLGKLDRLHLVHKNIKLLDNILTGLNESLWDCIIYIYAPKSDILFWDEGKNKIETISRLCEVILNPNQLFVSNLYSFNPSRLYNKYKYVFILLDDVNLINKTSFNVLSFIDIMEFNNATIASPRYLQYFL